MSKYIPYVMAGLMNITICICVTICAIHFDKWWLMFFLLCASYSVKTKSSTGGEEDEQ